MTTKTQINTIEKGLETPMAQRAKIGAKVRKENGKEVRLLLHDEKTGKDHEIVLDYHNWGSFWNYRGPISRETFAAFIPEEVRPDDGNFHALLLQEMVLSFGSDLIEIQPLPNSIVKIL